MGQVSALYRNRNSALSQAPPTILCWSTQRNATSVVRSFPEIGLKSIISYHIPPPPGNIPLSRFLAYHSWWVLRQWLVMVDASAFVATDTFDLQVCTHFRLRFGLLMLCRSVNPTSFAARFIKLWAIPQALVLSLYAMVSLAIIQHSYSAKMFRMYYKRSTLVEEQLKLAPPTTTITSWEAWCMNGLIHRTCYLFTFRFEDGSLPFLSIVSVNYGLQHIKSLGMDSIKWCEIRNVRVCA